MPQTLTTRGTATRQKMLEAAAQLIHFNGAKATTVDQILVKSDTGKSQFYHYFGSKEDVVRAVLDFWVQGYLGTIAQILAGKRSGLDELADLFDKLAESHGAHDFKGGCPIASLALELGESDPLIALDVKLFYERFRVLIAKEMAYMRKEGELPPSADPDGCAEFISAVIHGSLLLSTVRKDAAPLMLAKEHVSAYLRQLNRA